MEPWTASWTALAVAVPLTATALAAEALLDLRDMFWLF